MKKMQAQDIETLVQNVDKLVRNQQNMERFRKMVRQWYDVHTDGPEYELFPLSSRKHTTTEMYTVLAVIHDRYCGGMEQINPWPTSSLDVLSTVGTAYFSLFSDVDRRLYDNDKCTLENYLHHVTADLAHKKLAETKRGVGRPKEYTDDELERMQKAYDDRYQETKDSKAIWNYVADLYGKKSGDAIRKACSNFQRKLEKRT